LTVKVSLIFGKQFTIFKTVNRFPKLNSSLLHACLIFDCHNLVIVDCWNPIGAGVRQHPVIGILPEFGHQIPAGILPDSGQNGRIWIDPATEQAGSGQNSWILPLIGPDPVKLSRRNPATVTGRCRILAAFAKLWFLHFVIFFVRAKHRKIFSRKFYFLKMILSKLF
jgi:hypothetical protein